MKGQTSTFKRILLLIGIGLTTITGLILWYINVTKPANGLGTGLVTAALFFLGIFLTVVAIIWYLIELF